MRAMPLFLGGLLFVGVISYVPAAAAADSIYGIYDTSYGRMTIEPGPGGRIAEYTSDSGRIFATFSDTLMIGHWVEGFSTQKCDTKKDGSFHWGGIAYSFSPDFSGFEGKWGYCNKTLHGTWTGTRVGDLPTESFGGRAQPAAPDSVKCSSLPETIADVNRRLGETHQDYGALIDSYEEIREVLKIKLTTSYDGDVAYANLEYPDDYGALGKSLDWWLKWADKFVLRYAGDFAAVRPLVSKIREALDYFKIFGAGERVHKVPAAEGWAEWQKVNNMRLELISNLSKAIEQAYCYDVFEVDSEVHDLYTSLIPNSCGPQDTEALRRMLIRNRPKGLAPIWVERNFYAAQQQCRVYRDQ